VRFTLPRPYAAAERLFDGLAMLPRHLLEKPYREGKFVQSWSLNASANEVAGLGPFRLKQYVPGERVVLEVNSTFYAPLSAQNAVLWAKRTPPGFLFSVKAYALLTKLKKIDAPRRFEVTAAPPGEFLNAQRLFERYSKLSRLELEHENEELIRNYIKNFRETKKLTPYITGRFDIVQSYELTQKDIPAAISELEEALQSVLPEQSEIDGNDIARDEVTIYIYGSSADKMFNLLEPILKKSAFEDITITLRYGSAEDSDSKEKKFSL